MTEQPKSPEPITMTVIPVPASQSRTMRLANVLAMIGGAVALLPELVSDPAVAGLMNELMSPGARRVVAVAMVVIGFYLRKLRKETAAPIAGTPLATSDADR